MMGARGMRESRAQGKGAGLETRRVKSEESPGPSSGGARDRARVTEPKFK
jgi:hypothetical protein